MNKLSEEVERLKREMYGTADLVIRQMEVPDGELFVLYLDGMTDVDRLERNVLSVLAERGIGNGDAESLRKLIYDPMEIEEKSGRQEAILAISAGDAVLACGKGTYIGLGIRKYTVRTPSEPPTSAVLKGPREGFTEDIKTNMVLMRRRFRGGKLVIKSFTVGKYSATSVAVMYLGGVANKELVKAITEKISQIDVDGIVDSSYVAKCLEKRNYSMFKQNGTTEKPDILAAKMLEGRVGILVDGSPIAITLPFVLLEDLQDSQDYFKRAPRASLVRLIRLMAVFFSTLLPGVFVALQMHQFQVFPLKLLINVINSINGMPFSPIVEMLIALLFFEVLNEASIRMPRYVGMAISIVGAIILGETAVKAGILSSLTVLITAMSGIGLYAIPDEVGTFSVIRIMLVVVGAGTGIFGVTIGMGAIIAYVASINVYGADYLAPFAPIVTDDLKDAILKFDFIDMKKRPKTLGVKNVKRVEDEE